MSGNRTPTVRELGTATAFPNGARPGDILVGEAGGIAGAVALVNNAGVPLPIDATPFVPSDDNLTDAGSSAARFRTGYFGTSLLVGASATSQALAISQPAVNEGLLSVGTATGGFKLVSVALDPNGAQLTTAAAGGGAVVLEAYGSDADVAMTVRQKGGDGLVLGTTTGTMALFGGTARAKPTGATVLGAFTDPPSAAEMANLRTQFNLVVAGLATTTGLSVFTG